MKLSEALKRIECGKCSINDFKNDKELLLSLLDYDILLYNSLGSSLRKDSEVLDSILSKDNIPFGVKFGFDRSLYFFDSEKLCDEYMTIKLKSNYYRLFCLICNILPDLNYNLRNISKPFIEKFEQLISYFSDGESQLNIFKMFFGLYNGNIMSHSELCSLLKIDISEIEMTIQNLYNFLCDDSRLKFELVTLAREECEIDIPDKMYLNATRGLVELQKMNNYRYSIDELNLNDYIVYRLKSNNVVFIEQLEDDIDSILAIAGISDFKSEIQDMIIRFRLSDNKKKNGKRIK